MLTSVLPSEGAPRVAASSCRALALPTPGTTSVSSMRLNRRGHVGISPRKALAGTATAGDTAWKST